MPYKVVEADGKFCLEKEDTGERVDGSCHADRGETEAMMRAMYASEKKEADDAQEDARFERIWKRVKEKLGWKDDDNATGFKVAGNHWMAVWSNNFKDRDGELFTEKAMDAYVSRVDTGITPLPELWVWHGGKNVAIGAADWVARHGHFMMAAGQFYGGAPAQAAKAYYSRHAKNTGISHGFTYPAAQFDGKVYKAFNTFEISLLPRGTEANWYTSLEGVKAMALKPEQVEYLKTVFTEEHAARILEDWDKRGKALEDLGVEFKDFSATDDSAESADPVQTDKALTDLLGDVLESASVPVLAAQEAVKEVKALRAEIVELKAALQREIAETKALVAQRPRASIAAETVVETSHLSEALQEQLKQQNTEIDPFWRTEVQRTP